MVKSTPMNNVIREYWQSFYVETKGSIGYCSLCGNTGILDTTGVRTLTGIEVGRRNHCFCPNGQDYRKNRVKI